MTRWPIQRTWTVTAPDGTSSQASTAELSRYRGLALLGAAGLGKTFEIEELARVEKAASVDVRRLRLGDVAHSANVLAARLDALSRDATATTAIYLDALDEVMVPVRSAGRTVGEWLRATVPQSGVLVRISCRSAIFPESVRTALLDIYPHESTGYCSLHALTADDVDAVVRDSQLDVQSFRRALDRSGAHALAEQPLTLNMLLRLFRGGAGDLPANRLELFDQGLRLLITERVERQEEGTALDIPVPHLLEAAERLACFSLLSGRETVEYGEAPSDRSLNAQELAGLPGARPLDHETLRALRNSGLCERDGVYGFRFAHRQFQECLAGRRLATLLPHQAKAVLGSPLGWEAGVAGPLRETAAFAAMVNPAVAEWVAETDPEVVGLSDIADAGLRRRATINLLEKFRRHELTDAQLSRDGLALKGFQYQGAEHDLRVVFRERRAGCNDVLEAAIQLAQAWELVAVSHDLATLALDRLAPQDAREAAGHALIRFGTDAARMRLLPLISGSEDDPNENLKGIALRCNHPGQMSVPELLAALTPVRRALYGGDYSSFLHSLDAQRFEARDFRVEGLAWARAVVRPDSLSESDPLNRIARRIARAAVYELEHPAVSAALASLLLHAAHLRAASPLSPLSVRGRPHNDGPDDQPIASWPDDIRRRLFTLLVQHATARADFWLLAREPADLLAPDDLEWLLAQSTDERLAVDERSGYAELARLVPWADEARCVGLWLSVRDCEPANTRIPFALSVELDSEYAQLEREQYAALHRPPADPPADTVSRALDETLDLAERMDPRYFIHAARLLTISLDDPQHYGFNRFLTTTERWRAASEVTRARVIEAAKRLLVGDTEEPEKAAAEPLDSVLGGFMPAVWLLTEVEPGWLDLQDPAWWHRWSWYFLRELRPRHADEEEQPKRLLLQKLFIYAPDDITDAIVMLATAPDDASSHLVARILDIAIDIAPASLDCRLRDLIGAGALSLQSLRQVVRFLLRRNADRALEICYGQLEGSPAGDADAAGITVAVTLLCERPSESWPTIAAYLRRRSDLARRVLGEYAQTERALVRTDDRPESDGFSVSQLGELTLLLIEAYPYDADPVHDGAYWVGPIESACHLRTLLVTWLSEQRTLETVDALRALERRFGGRFPGLRRPRATAERGYRLGQWEPVEPASVATLLAGADKRLLRSNADALDAVVAAIERFAHRLQHSSPSDLEDLWNRPSSAPPTPKEEERASDKVCVALREYLLEYAVTADREVQVFRRLVRSEDSAPGSEVDVLCTIPAMATAARDSIVIPVEVKLAHNREARDGMRVQLANRYMSELGTDSGAYVVIWLTAPGMPRRYRPLWPAITEAEADLQSQADALKTAGLDVRVIVVDASLPSRTLTDHPAARSVGTDAAGGATI